MNQMHRRSDFESHWLAAFIDQVRSHRDQPALIAKSRPPIRWRELAARVDQRATEIRGMFRDLPTTQPRRVAHFSDNAIDDVVVALACMAAGVVEVPIDARLTPIARRRLLDRSGAILLDRSTVNDPHSINAIDAAVQRLVQQAEMISPESPAIILWTSGTTDQPKGVVLSHGNLMTNAAAKLEAVPQNPSDIRLTLLPLCHAYARTCDMGTWLLSGCRWVLDRGAGGLDRVVPDSLPTLINAVPSLASRILERLDRGDRSVSRLRMIGCGGAAMDAGRYARFRDHGVEVIQGYGCTETSPVICSGRPGSSRAGCVGPMVRSWEHRVVDGRLHVRGPCVMNGYLEDPDSTSARISQDGWFDTGDLVEIEPDGQFRILGRADNVIVLENGYKLNPISIEQALLVEHGFEHVVVMNVPPRLIIGIQPVAPEPGRFDQERLEHDIRDLLPPSTRFLVHPFDPPLSIERDELTIKGTPKPDGVRRRFVDEVH